MKESCGVNREYRWGMPQNKLQMLNAPKQVAMATRKNRCHGPKTSCNGNTEEKMPLRHRNSQSEPMGNKEVDLALKKLNVNLSSGKSLREDVPRGFYLNVRI